MITMYIVRELSPFNLILRKARMDPNGLRHGVPDRAGKDLARVWNTSSTASPGHFLEEKEKRSEKPETRYGLVCSYVRISGENKTSNKRQ